MLIILFLVSHFNFLFVPCGRLSWLPVSFLLHVKHTLSYRIESSSVCSCAQHMSSMLVMPVSSSVVGVLRVKLSLHMWLRHVDWLFPVLSYSLTCVQIINKCILCVHGGLDVCTDYQRVYTVCTRRPWRVYRLSTSVYCAYTAALTCVQIINECILCVHGGLSPDLKTLDQVRTIERNQEIPHKGAFCGTFLLTVYCDCWKYDLTEGWRERLDALSGAIVTDVW